jgi:hypothetical protein
MKDPDAWLQTLIYCEAYLSNNPGIILLPSVYKVKKLGRTPKADRLRLKTETKEEIVVDDYSIVRVEFLNSLKEIISEIFNKDSPFTMTNDKRGKCSYCPYKSLCLR